MTQACYDGPTGTENIGICKGGTQTCGQDNLWSSCAGEVLPMPEVCDNGVDDDCNGMTDENIDADGDGWTTCGGDCCDSTEFCSNPAAVNPGAFEVLDGVDNNCDGIIDNVIPPCDGDLTSNTTNPLDFAKAMELCETSVAGSNAPKGSDGPRWGIISATWTYADGTGTASANGHAIRPHFGQGTVPQAGSALALLGTNTAAAMDDTSSPSWQDAADSIADNGESGFPADWLAANGGKLPNAPGCPGPEGSTANDPQMLTLQIRVPTNAYSFSLSTNFFSSEFAQWVCSPFNDFFVVLLDSAYQGSGSAANPADKNLAFYQNGSGDRYPVGVNLAYGNTGLFTECKNGDTGCGGEGPTGSINTCKEITELVGTGLDQSSPGNCDDNSLEGGGTGWLVTTGNVVPGEIITLRIALWNTSDHQYQSYAVVDDFKWSVTPSNPGTTIEIVRPSGEIVSRPVPQYDLR